MALYRWSTYIDAPWRARPGRAAALYRTDCRERRRSSRSLALPLTGAHTHANTQASPSPKWIHMPVWPGYSQCGARLAGCLLLMQTSSTSAGSPQSLSLRDTRVPRRSSPVSRWPSARVDDVKSGLRGAVHEGIGRAAGCGLRVSGWTVRPSHGFSQWAERGGGAASRDETQSLFAQPKPSPLRIVCVCVCVCVYSHVLCMYSPICTLATVCVREILASAPNG